MVFEFDQMLYLELYFFGYDQKAFHIQYFFFLCSDEVLKMITNCNMRIGSVGWKRLGEAYTSFESSTISVVFSLLTSSKPGAIKEVSVDDSVESLWKLCRILYRASLLTARNVVIHFIENGICDTL